MPAVARILGCAIESQCLRVAYKSLYGKCIGFSHSAVDSFRSKEYFINIPIWQYDYTKLSPVFELGALHYSGSTRIEAFDWKEAHFDMPGKCDGILLWVQYENTSGMQFTTFDEKHHQCLYLISNSVPILKKNEGFKCKMELNQDLSDFELLVKFQNQ